MLTDTEELLKRIIDRYKRFAKVSRNLGNHSDYLYWSLQADIYEAKLATLRIENANQGNETHLLSGSQGTDSLSRE